VKTAAASAIAAPGLGLEGILAARTAPATAQDRSIHFLLLGGFAPPGDVEIRRQGAEWGKQQRVTVRIEQINPNDIPPRVAAAMESKQGPDIVQFFHNWQNQYADAVVDVSDIATALEAKYGPYIEYAKAHATLGGRFTAVPHTIVPHLYVVRRSYLEAAGTRRWPTTWDELRREGKKWRTAGYPIGQTVGHTVGDAVVFAYSYLWSFGAAERDERGRVIIGSAQTREALKFFKALWDDAMDPAGPGWDDVSNNRAFLSGAIAATINAPSIYLTASNQLILDDKRQPLVGDILHLPHPAGPAGVAHYHYTQQLAIPKYSRNVDAAKEFLSWLMDQNQLATYLRRAQAYHAAALKVYLNDPMWDMFPALKPYRDHLLDGRHLGWKGPADGRAARVVQDYAVIDMFAAVATGKLSPEESVRRGESQLKAIYGG
jgi:multiple sugar transport system substrate-binding protein